MQSLRIVALCIGAAMLYGVLHNQVTARVCLEYFTIGHPPVFDTESPTVIAIGWGILATWWMGLLLGVPLALVARAGSRPRRDALSLIRPTCFLLGVMALGALLAGIIGSVLAASGAVILVEPLASRVPQERHVAFIADLWAHSSSYLVGLLGGIVVMWQVWRSRGSARTETSTSR